MNLPDDSEQWFVMRDLSRPHSHNPMYRVLADEGYNVFTPMIRKIGVERGRRVNKDVPFIHDLVFVKSSRSSLDIAVERHANLQYRYVIGAYCKPMVVSESDMDTFIAIVGTINNPRYYRPEEITPQMIGAPVRLLAGPMAGYEGRLLSLRGSRKKRLLVQLPGIISAAIEVEPDTIEILKQK